LSILGTIPQKYLDTAVLIDIGSGNTKGGYRESGGRVATWDIPYGTKTFHAAAGKQTGNTFADKVPAARTALVTPALKEKAELRPGMVNRERVYLSGGAVWVSTNLSRPRDRNTFREIKADDFRTLGERLRDDPSRVPP